MNPSQKPKALGFNPAPGAHSRSVAANAFDPCATAAHRGRASRKTISCRNTMEFPIIACIIEASHGRIVVMSETITRIYGTAENAQAAVQRLKSFGFTDEAISFRRGSGVAAGAAADQWSVSVRPLFGMGRLATELLDRFNPIGAVSDRDDEPEPGTISWLSRSVWPGSISRLSGPVSSRTITHLSRRVSPGPISKLSGPVSHGVISRLSGRRSTGAISRLSGPVRPGAVANMSGPIGKSAISGLSGPVPAGMTACLSRRVSPGAISKMSGPVSPGPISKMSGHASPGPISRMSGPASPGPISRMSGPSSSRLISRLSGHVSPGYISLLSR